MENYSFLFGKNSLIFSFSNIFVLKKQTKTLKKEKIYYIFVEKFVPRIRIFLNLYRVSLLICVI